MPEGCGVAAGAGIGVFVANFTDKGIVYTYVIFDICLITKDIQVYLAQMDPNAPGLKSYINTQRLSGVQDRQIYENLVSVGWSHDIVLKHLQDLPQVVDKNIPLPSSPTAVLSHRDGTKTVKIIGFITIVFGVLHILLNDPNQISWLQVCLGVAYVLVGVGLLHFSRLSYTLFNVLAILAIIFGILALPVSVGLLLVFIYTPGVSLYGLLFPALVAILSVAPVAFFIWGGIVLHKEKYRSLFT